jgi:cytidine deaminase
MKKEFKELVKAALEVKRNSYSPFSKFRVGAALLCKDGRIFTGCNIENSSYGLTICAERVAIFNAISSGASEFTTIAIISDARDITPPCGACRQVLSDLASDIDIIMVDCKNRNIVLKLSSLLPFAFTGKNLKKSYKLKK